MGMLGLSCLDQIVLALFGRLQDASGRSCGAGQF
jgi:hypothetical protein